LALTLLVLASGHDPVALIPFIVLTAATVGIAWRTEAATAAVPVAAILAAAVMAHWAVHERLDALIAPPGPPRRQYRVHSISITARISRSPRSGLLCLALPGLSRRVALRAP
jgi:hypothetical protein